MKLPKSATKNIVVQNLGKEILIYDLQTDKAFCLNETLSIVYPSCDGQTTLDELKSQTGFTEDLIFLALDQLRESNLIQTDTKSFLGGLSRREAIRKIGRASMIMLPILTCMVAPRALVAASAVCPPVTDGENGCLDDGAGISAGTATNRDSCLGNLNAVAFSACCSLNYTNPNFNQITRCCTAQCATEGVGGGGGAVG